MSFNIGSFLSGGGGSLFGGGGGSSPFGGGGGSIFEQISNVGSSSGMNGAVDMVLNAHPIGMGVSTISDMLGFDLSANITNVLSSGDLSNWGASGSADKVQGFINQFFRPEIDKYAEAIDPMNPSQGMTTLSHYIKTVRTNFHQKRVEHSKATSTKKGNELGRSQMDKMHTEILGKLETAMRKAGYVIKKSTKKVKGNPNNFVNNFSSDKPHVDSMQKNGGGQWEVSYTQYQITPPKRPLPSLPTESASGQGDDVKSFYGGEMPAAYIETKGESYLGLGLVGLATAAVIYYFTKK